MNSDLSNLLRELGVSCQSLSKAEKVRCLSRWCHEFPNLVGTARHGRQDEGVVSGRRFLRDYEALPAGGYFVLPDDRSGMPAVQCSDSKPPDLSRLVTDLKTVCDELVVVDAAYRWSAVFVNHGSPEMVGRHLALRQP